MIEEESPNYLDNGYDKYLSIDSTNQDVVTSANAEKAFSDGVIDLSKTTISNIKSGQAIQSANYISGTSGWIINGDGTCELGSGTFRGSIYIPNATSPKFSVDTAGNVIASSLRRRDFHWFTCFESKEGYGISCDGTGAVIIGFNGISLKTGTVIGNITEILKTVANTAKFSWDKPRSFKTTAWIESNGHSHDLKFYVGTGSHQSSTDRFIGFRFEFNYIYANTGNGTSYTSTSIQAYDPDQYYELEVLYEPGVSAKYYINNSLVATITSTLPSGSTSAEMMFYASTETKESYENYGDLPYFDFWQGI